MTEVKDVEALLDRLFAEGKARPTNEVRQGRRVLQLSWKGWKEFREAELWRRPQQK